MHTLTYLWILLVVAYGLFAAVQIRRAERALTQALTDACGTGGDLARFDYKDATAFWFMSWAAVSFTTGVLLRLADVFLN